MNQDMIQWIVGQVGTAGIAALALVMLNRSWETQLANQKTTQEELTEQRKTLMELGKAAVVAMNDMSNVARDSIAASHELCGEVRNSLASTRRMRKGDKEDA